MNEQRTLRDVLEFSGVGLHTGSEARVRLRPGFAGSGLRFRLLDRNVAFPAHAEYIVETRRATVLGSGDATVSTVEHLMAALLGMGVDNALIEVEGREIPVIDGSAAAFAEAIAKVGVVGQRVPPRMLVLDRPRRLSRRRRTARRRSRRNSFACASRWTTPRPVGAQFIDAAIDPDFFIREIAPARTFGYLHEVEALRSAGLARGGTLDNALVFAPDGPLTPLRWPNEVVRHKVLDLIGDFALLGARPCCEVVSVKSGHRLHAAAVQALRRSQATHVSAASGA